jgi:hypothetical protein
MPWCSICEREEKELKHLPIYVTGSEGVDVCHACDMSLTEHVRGLVSMASRAKMEACKQWKGHTDNEKKLTELENKNGGSYMVGIPPRVILRMLTAILDGWSFGPITYRPEPQYSELWVREPDADRPRKVTCPTDAKPDWLTVLLDSGNVPKLKEW